MLTDEQVDVYYALIRDRIDRVNDKYLKEIGEQIAAIGELNPSSVRKLAQMRKFGASSEKMRRELARMLRASQGDIQALYQKAIDEEYADAAYALSKIGEDISDPKQNKELVRYMEAVAKQTAETFQNWSNTTVIDQNYQRIVSDGVDAVSRGVSDYQSVIRRSIKEYGGDGLSVVYESGVRRRLDTAIRQNILDGTRQISQQCAKMIGEEIGADGVELSAHPFSALDHEPCQGRQYTTENYERMQSGQNFQDVDGKTYEGFDRPITQWNCRHFASPILIGISPRRYTDAQLEAWKQANHKGCEIDGKHYTIYQASQLMRKLEAEVRRQKDIANLAEASGDDVLRRDAQYRITKCKAAYRKVSEACGLKQRPDKMRVPSYSSKDSKVETVETGSMDYMASNFKPQYPRNGAVSKVKGTDFDVKRVTNSRFNLYVDSDSTQRDYGIRLTEANLRLTQEKLPDDFILPKIVATNFGRHSIGEDGYDSIAGYNQGTNIVFINTEYDTHEKIIEYVTRQEGFFANKTELAPYLHEFGHKYYYDIIKSVYKRNKISYNEACDMVDSNILASVTQLLSEGNGLDKISFYADKGFITGKISEIIAECFSVRGENEFADYILERLGELL